MKTFHKVKFTEIVSKDYLKIFILYDITLRFMQNLYVQTVLEIIIFSQT